MSDVKSNVMSEVKDDRNSTNFPLYTYERLKGKKFNANDLELYHQFLVRQFIMDNPSIRGMLAFHEMGSGKTRLGANNVKDYIKDRQIVIIAPSSVFSKFVDEFKAIGVEHSSVNFISLRASNLEKQIERLEGGPKGAESFDFEEINAVDFIRKNPLDNTFLIVDEAHNLFNAVINGSKNAIALYDTIMSAKNIKLLFLSGSPIVNTPFELSPCFNMLAGYKLFPEVQEDFEKYFISRDMKHAINGEKFKNRIYGLVSYFGDWIQTVARAHRPKKLPTSIVKVPMSETQYAIYSTYRDKEHEEASFKSRKKPERFAPKSGSSSYRIKSRQACNFTPIGKHRDLKNKELAPKFYAALDIINKHPKQLIMVSSNFVHDCGLIDFASLLKLNGWEEWTAEDDTSKVNRYAIISGDTPLEDREAIQKISSSKENIHGAIIQIVLVGPAGAEGIEFKNFRVNIQLEPFFNAVRSDQFETRIDRFNSHVMLPEAERTVKTYVMLATYPSNITNVKEPTTDEFLYTQSKLRKLLSLEFYRLMIEASPECPIHRDNLPATRAQKIKCLLCSPTGVKLFHDDLDKDIKSANPCKPPVAQTVKAKEIIIESDGEEKRYMYVKNKEGTEFYEFVESLNGYIPVLRNHKDFDTLMQKVGQK